MSKTARKHGAGGPASRAAHQVRIIGGQWKRTPLPVVDGDGLRPTPDRVRETLFNWLTHLLDGNWEGVSSLDLFAGSGALGFEAASRGAARVALVENYGPAVRQLEASKEKLKAAQVEVLRGDALALLQGFVSRAGSARGFDLILTPTGLLYVESEQALDGDAAPAWMAFWEIVRADKAGMVFYHLLRRKNIA